MAGGPKRSLEVAGPLWFAVDVRDINTAELLGALVDAVVKGANVDRVLGHVDAIAVDGTFDLGLRAGRGCESGPVGVGAGNGARVSIERS